MSHALSREAKRLSRSAVRRLREDGPRGLVREAADFAWSYAGWRLKRPDRNPQAFEFQGRRIPYVRHPYNRAWRNERSVELALARDFVERHRGTRILEIGNVLGHYGPVNHCVLDKYESSPGVTNADVVDFDPAEPFDAIVSISTLEHVGWDEHPREPEKVLRARANLLRLLRPGGPLLVTVALGYNPHLDRYLAEGRFEFPGEIYMKRINRANEWREADAGEVQGARYGAPFRNANAIFVGVSPGSG